MNLVLKNGPLFAIMTLLAFCLLMTNNVVNRHYHLIYKNHVVSHAHPFSRTNSEETPYQPHQHSDFEWLIYDLISNSPIIMALIITINTIIAIFVVLNEYAQPQSAGPVFIPLNDSRAPPF